MPPGFLNCICDGCIRNIADAITLCGGTVYTLQYIVYSEIGRLFTFRVSDEVLEELRMVMARCMNTYVDRRMNSLEILDALI